MTRFPTVAIIGFGEVGQALAEDLRGADVGEIAVWDITFADRASRPSQALVRHAVRQLAIGALALIPRRTLAAKIDALLGRIDEK